MDTIASLLVAPSDFQLGKALNGADSNRALYDSFLNSPRTRDVASIPDGSLVEKGQRIAYLDPLSETIKYYVQYERGSFRGIKTITQIALWADESFPLPTVGSASMISWVFFNYLLPKADALSADPYQTSDGMRFWLRRMQAALGGGMLVYMVARDQDAVVKLKSLEDITRVAKAAWGTEKRHAFRRAFIARRPIFKDALTVDDYISQVGG
jgi:hypothetical protein